MPLQPGDFPDLRLDGPHDGVLRLVISNPGRLNAVTAPMHAQLSALWPAVNADEQIRAVLVSGDGEAFSAGGDMDMLERMTRDAQVRTAALEEARALVTNMIECDTPVVSAIRGPAVGAGLAVALLADISIATPGAKLLDGHVRIGVAAGDHAVVIWPLLCGLAKAKRYLLLPDALTGEEAERIGLVSMCVPDAELDATAADVARRLADGPPNAVQWTKRALNHWLRQAEPAFEASLGYEFLGFAGAEGAEGVAALREKRAPQWTPPR